MNFINIIKNRIIRYIITGFIYEFSKITRTQNFASWDFEVKKSLQELVKIYIFKIYKPGVTLD